MSDYTGDGGLATAATFRNPGGVAVDRQGTIYISDTDNNVVRVVDTAGLVSTVAGNGTPGYAGDGGPASSAELSSPMGLAIDSQGNLLIADAGNNVVRCVNHGSISTVAGNGTSSDGNPDVGDGSLASLATLSNPTALALDASDNLYIADTWNSRIRYVDASTHLISTVAGTGDLAYQGDDGPASAAALSWPSGVAVAANGDIYIADSIAGVIRKVDHATQIINTLVLSDSTGQNRQNNLQPDGITLDAHGSLYIADGGSSVIWRVDLANDSLTLEVGIDSTVPSAYQDSTSGGMGAYDGPHSILLNIPSAIACDASDNLLLADTGNQVVRRESFQTGTLEYFGNGTLAATVTNQSIAPVLIDSVSVTGANASDFSIQNECSSQLLPGASCSVGVTFSGSDQNLESAELHISANHAATLQQVALVGIGSNVAVFSLSSSSLTLTGQVSQTSPAQLLTLTNTGSASGIISGISIVGPNAADFHLANTCGTALAAGASCSLSVSFTASLASSESATLQISDNSRGIPESVILAGIGTGTATITGAPSALSFVAGLGQVSAPQVVTLRNIGSFSISFVAISVSGVNADDFRTSNNCGATLASGASCSLQLNFAPSQSGAETAMLHVNDSAGNSPQTITLAGTGIGPVSLSTYPTSLNFTGQLGQVSPAQTVTVGNSSSVVVSVPTLQVVGMNAGDFRLASNCGSTLGAGANCALQITFAPSISGAESASVSLALNSSASSPLVALTGSTVRQFGCCHVLAPGPPAPNAAVISSSTQAVLSPSLSTRSISEHTLFFPTLLEAQIAAVQTTAGVRRPDGAEAEAGVSPDSTPSDSASTAAPQLNASLAVPPSFSPKLRTGLLCANGQQGCRGSTLSPASLPIGGEPSTTRAKVVETTSDRALSSTAPSVIHSAPHTLRRRSAKVSRRRSKRESGMRVSSSKTRHSV